MEAIKRIHPKYGALRIIVKEGVRYYSLPDIARIFGFEDLDWVEDQCSFRKACINPNLSVDEAPFEYLYMHEIDAVGFSRVSPDEKRDEWLFGKEDERARFNLGRQGETNILNEYGLYSKEKGEVENMNDVQVFNSEEFGQVRVLEIDGEPWFVGKDVAKVLQYKNPSKALIAHVGEEDKQFMMIDIADSQNGNVPIGQSKTAIINESGLYNLIFSSKLPTAKQFKKWVTSKVLPSIRKHGAYMTDEKLDEIANNPDLLIKLATNLKKEREARKEAEAKLEIAAPKVEYYDDVLQCDNLVPITTIAKDYGWSAMKMNHYLENRKIQYRTGRQWVLYQKYADKGYTMSKTFTDGAYLNIQTYWTQKGRKFIYDLLASEEIFPNN